MKRSVRLVFVVCIVLQWGRGGAPAAVARNVLAIGSVTAQSGDRAVAVELFASTEQPLSLLSVDLEFAPVLCGVIANQRVRAAGRARANPQDGGLRCPDEGRIRLVMVDFLGEAVIPPGSGVIAEWVFDVRDDAASAVFQLTLTVNQASQGPITVPLTATGGLLTIVSNPTRTPSPGPTPATETCAGDCNQDGAVTVDEIVRGVSISLGGEVLAGCPSLDRNRDSAVTIDELVAAVRVALAGCEIAARNAAPGAGGREGIPPAAVSGGHLGGRG